MKKLFTGIIAASMLCVVAYAESPTYHQIEKPVNIKSFQTEDGRKIQLDAATWAMTTIEYEHHEIHSGSHYYVCGYDPDVDAAEELDFRVVTPNTAKWAHMIFSIEGTGATVFSIYEDSTYSTVGTTVTPMNNNRNYPDNSSLVLHSGATVLTSGTTIYQQAFGVSGNPTNTRGGSEERSREIVLKQNTTYRFRIESNSDNNIISWCGEWYEHTNK